MSVTNYTPKQLMVLGGLLLLTLMLAGGFLFGPAASYAGITDNGGKQNSKQKFNASLPQQNYKEGSFGLTAQEQRVLAAQNDVVFLNVFYRTEGELEQVRNIKGVENNFNDRLYVQVSNYSESSNFQSYGFTDLPKAVAVGGSRQGIKIVNDVSEAGAASASCSVMRDWGSLVAYCQGR